MKVATKKKLLKVLDMMEEAVEKCGGRGGTPGPCPSSGGGNSGGSRNKPPKKPDHDIFAHYTQQVLASDARKKPPKKPEGDAKPATRQIGDRKEAKKIQQQAKKVRSGSYDLDTVSGTVKYFANAAVKTLDKAISKAEKVVSKIENAHSKARKKLDSIKAAKASAVKGAVERYSRVSALFKRLRALTKSAKERLDSQLADELDGLADSMDEILELADIAEGLR